jgi:hypothetical protein
MTLTLSGFINCSFTPLTRVLTLSKCYEECIGRRDERDSAARRLNPFRGVEVRKVFLIGSLSLTESREEEENRLKSSNAQTKHVFGVDLFRFHYRSAVKTEMSFSLVGINSLYMLSLSCLATMLRVSDGRRTCQNVLIKRDCWK